MRIVLCVHHRLDANTGAPGITLRLGSEYEALGHDVAYVSFNDLPPRLPDPARELLFPEAAAWLLRRRGAGAEVIDATTGDAWLWARLGRRRGSPKLVTRSHGLEHVYWQATVDEARAEGHRLPARTRWYHGGLRLWEVAASLRASDACVFSNHPDLEHAVARLGVQRDRATVVLNGIPAEFQHLELHAIENGAGVAVIGTWASRKGARYAAEALGAVLLRRPDLRALLLGTRVPEREVLAAFPEPVRSRVTVIESYDHSRLPQLLEGAQVLLSASLAEGFSVAVPEAMAAGLAPVATALPGTRELVRDGENGLLVPPRDARALESALDRVLEDRDLLARLRSQAQVDAQQLSWRRIAERNLQVYEAALSRGV
jgi:glycosyltransferase involved in cell wall biosynthesis